MSYKQNYSIWVDPLRLWKFTFRAWEVVLAVGWIVLTVLTFLLGNYFFDFKVSWWVGLIGAFLALGSYLTRTNIAYKISLYLGFPYILRKQGVTPTERPLMGSLTRWLVRTMNAAGLSVWVGWLVYILIRLLMQEDWQFAALSTISVLLGICTFIPNFSFFTLLDKNFLFKRTRFALLVSVLIWVGFILAFRSWEFQFNNRIFCPFYLCLGG